MSVKSNIGVVTDELFLYLDPGNENSYSGSGTTANDLSGSLVADLDNGTSYLSSNGGVFNFDGTNDLIDLKSNLASGKVNFSVGGWCRSHTNSSDGTFFGLWGATSGSADQFLLWWDVGGSNPNWRFIMRDGANTVRATSDGQDNGNINQWSYIMVTHDGSGLKLYIDGALDQSVSTNGSIRTSSEVWALGNQNIGGNPRYLDGEIGPFHVYNKTLAASEVLQNYNALKNRFENTKGVVTDGLVFYVDPGHGGSYPGSGTTLTDLAGSNNGTLTNGPTYSSNNGGTLVFDGTNDYVSCTSFVIPAKITVSAWVNPDSTSASRMLNASDDSTAVVRNWQLRTNTNGTVTAIAFHTSSPNNIQLTTTETLSTGVWKMVSFTSDGSNLKIYFDGVEKASVSFPYNILGNGSVGDFLLAGRKTSSVADTFDGKQGPTAVYDRALSATELLQNYNALKNRFT